MKMKLMWTLLGVGALLSAAGCANGYREFYTPAADVRPEAISSIRVSAPPPIPAIERALFSDRDALMAKYRKRGYLVIGESSFNTGERVSDDQALKQGQAVGADLVLIFLPQYTRSVTSSKPLTTPTMNTSYTTGPGGLVPPYSNATTGAYGRNTTYVPFTADHYDYGAIYFVKRRLRIGAFVRNLNELERQLLQTNQGVVVMTIVNDSPAYKADILPGDMITAMDGERVTNHEGFTRMAAERKGRMIIFSLVRQGRVIEKSLQAGD